MMWLEFLILAGIVFLLIVVFVLNKEFKQELQKISNHSWDAVNAKVVPKIDDILSLIQTINQKETSKEEVKKMLQHSLELLAENSTLKERQKEYHQFFGIILQTLNEDTDFLRGSLVKGFSMDIPQVREFNSQILAFQNRIIMIKQAMKDQKMVEELEDKLDEKEEVKIE